MAVASMVALDLIFYFDHPSHPLSIHYNSNRATLGSTFYFTDGRKMEKQINSHSTQWFNLEQIEKSDGALEITEGTHVDDLSECQQEMAGKGEGKGFCMFDPALIHFDSDEDMAKQSERIKKMLNEEIFNPMDITVAKASHLPLFNTITNLHQDYKERKGRELKLWISDGTKYFVAQSNQEGDENFYATQKVILFWSIGYQDHEAVMHAAFFEDDDDEKREAREEDDAISAHVFYIDLE